MIVVDEMKPKQGKLFHTNVHTFSQINGTPTAHISGTVVSEYFSRHNSKNTKDTINLEIINSKAGLYLPPSVTANMKPHV